ncbi:DMT family transporter [Aliiruegeria sabulilitoris]|uniref:DMT family transporter n=1 Tax=Aliiruegeria sabulilitoris TaxID=1510458 RepID=UPI000832B3E2|nr:DMT family transporter [Aliiruegeria sabulilitoris]NDR56876.1 DMT family transporter [Pseudoruegeria sp. M32A2M]
MPTPSPQDPGLTNWLLIIALGVIWGAAFMSMTVALEGFGYWTVAALRLAVGAVALTAIGTAIGQGFGEITRTGGARGWVYAILLGIESYALPFALLTWGLQHVPSAFAGVTMGMLPLLVLPLVAIFSPEEGIGPRRIAGIGLGSVGLLILFGPSALESEGSQFEPLGRLAILLAAFCYAVGSVATRRAPRMPPLAFAAASLASGAIILLPIAIWIEGWPAAWPLRPTLALLYAALFPTALAAAIRIRVITTAGSLFMTLTNYMLPIWAVIFGIVLLDEELPPQLFIALALILAGIAVSQSRAIQAAFGRRRG